MQTGQTFIAHSSNSETTINIELRVSRLRRSSSPSHLKKKSNDHFLNTFSQTNIARAWDFKKPIIVCPAMNNLMWGHPITLKQVETLKEFGYKVIFPIEKKLACGEYGIGGMQEIDKIVELVISELKVPQKESTYQ